MTKGTRRQLRTGTGDWISPQELQEVLAEEGYSGPDREGFLNSVLTELAAENAGESEASESGQALLAEVRSILEKEQGKHGRRPIAGDLP